MLVDGNVSSVTHSCGRAVSFANILKFVMLRVSTVLGMSLNSW